ncbi:hypothetical protein [Vibrio parahaemolyticus]|uniref:hypothetical protein n=1 Tax=Vibrio parahaemolyticus TaxID=670 RepID=UPI0009F15CB4|nr:hypothetical protein [Vibrio parahaemolyticus]OQU28097.1 hypothetical protein EM47_001240 [Vibrio parahaemolyticus]
MTLKVETEITGLKPSHGNLVFTDKQTATHRDLAKSIGRFDPAQQAIQFFDDKDVGTKYKVLFQNGFGMTLTRNEDGNWYVDLSPARDMMESLEANTDERVKDKSVDHKERPTIMIDEKEFLQDHNDGAIDITFTTPDMTHVHTVGYLNPVTHRYTIRRDLINELDDFEYEMDESDVEAPTAVVQSDSIKAGKLLKLLSLLKAEDNEDGEGNKDSTDELKESIERNAVYAPALGGIKALLKAMTIARRLGDKEAVSETLNELNQQLSELEQGNVEGIDKVRDEIDAILDEPKTVSEREFIEQQVDAGRRHTSMTDHELMAQALKY